MPDLPTDARRNDMELHINGGKAKGGEGASGPTPKPNGGN
ncbi:hypothetical protein FHX34_103467 [Actinoplanes teichomyceticus]|uniref:Uncharacterized protein n=1 Tax=Actinoplanes teichomyceticus TaxID=1867 RepID=A0A561WAP9_ACTTI|nr:hypothetical protein FHX34_103467 [Actinoplanes teichomyceticus]GIF16524.1 hypothetical protein Ate01nite_65560 [Actinoplanes teichomyceticus]